MDKETLQAIKDAIDAKIAEVKKTKTHEELLAWQSLLNENLIEGISKTVTEAIANIKLVTPSVNVPDVIVPKVEVPEIDTKAIVQAINGIKITVPKTNVPEAKVTVDIPPIKLPKFPEIKIPKIEVPKIEIPKIVIPKIEVPDVIMPDSMKVQAEKPLPVNLLDLDGKPMSFPGSGGGFQTVGLKDKSNQRINPATFSDYSLELSRGNIPGMSFIHKFGNAPDFDTGDLSVSIWDGANDGGINEMNYNYSTTAVIDSISTDGAGEGQDVEVQGLDANYELKIQTVTLNGHQRVALPSSLIRVFRMKNEGVTDFSGTVVAYENTAIVDGIPSDTTKIRAVISGNNNQTLMAIYTIPAGKKGYMRDWYAVTAGAKKTTNYVIDLFARPFGKVFQLKHRSALIEDGSSDIQFKYDEPEMFNEKTDIEMRARITANTITLASVSAGFNIVLVDN